jgi:hypothetical protein
MDREMGVGNNDTAFDGRILEARGMLVFGVPMYATVGHFVSSFGSSCLTIKIPPHFLPFLPVDQC